MTDFRFDDRFALIGKETAYNDGTVLDPATNAIVWLNGRGNDSPTVLERNQDRTHSGSRPAVLVDGTTTVQGEAENYVLGEVPDSADSAPALDPLWLALGMARTNDLTPTSEKVIYTPVSANHSSAPFWFKHAAVLKKINGVRGTATINLTIDEFLRLTDITMTGLQATPETSALAEPTFPTDDPPVVDTDNWAFTLGGNAYDCYTQTCVLGVTNNLRKGSEAKKVRNVGHAYTGVIRIYQDDLSAFNPFTHRKNHDRLALTSTVQHENGGVFEILAPAVQITEVNAGEQAGDATWDLTVRYLPVNGNDELQIIYRFVNP